MTWSAARQQSKCYENNLSFWKNRFRNVFEMLSSVGGAPSEWIGPGVIWFLTSNMRLIWEDRHFDRENSPRTITCSLKRKGEQMKMKTRKTGKIVAKMAFPYKITSHPHDASHAKRAYRNQIKHNRITPIPYLTTKLNYVILEWFDCVACPKQPTDQQPFPFERKSYDEKTPTNNMISRCAHYIVHSTRHWNSK